MIEKLSTIELDLQKDMQELRDKAEANGFMFIGILDKPLSCTQVSTTNERVSRLMGLMFTTMLELPAQEMMKTKVG